MSEHVYAPDLEGASSALSIMYGRGMIQQVTSQVQIHFIYSNGLIPYIMV